MKKEHVKAVLAVMVMVIGVYMFVNNAWPTPPAVSGLGFFLVGFGQWLNFCPVCKKICKK